MATGKDAAFGFAVWDKLIRANLYAVITAPTIGFYHGQVCQHGGSHISTKEGYLPTVEDGAECDGEAGLVGAVIAIFDENMDPVKYIAAAETGNSTIAGYLMIADSPDQLFVAQEDSDGNAITLTEGGHNCNLIGNAGNTTTGISLAELDSDSTAETAALQCKIVRPHPLDTPTSDYCRYIVQINEHFYGDSIIGVTE
jgi:hypothetical protein